MIARSPFRVRRDLGEALSVPASHGLIIGPASPPTSALETYGAPLHLGMRYRGRAVDVVFAPAPRLGLRDARAGAAPSRPSDPWEGERRSPRA